MFYEITDKLNEITIEQLNSNKPSVGIIKSDELTSIGRRLGFDEETIEASQKANPVFRTVPQSTASSGQSTAAQEARYPDLRMT